MKKIKFLDLFAGIGGFSLGLERAGMECVGQVEIDSYCNKVLEKHWPDVKRIKDVHNVKGGEFGTIRLICGGFPCQPFSFAGNQKGKKDDRYLWPEMVRVIKLYNPDWLLLENVPGIINMELDTVLSDLESAGYSCQTFNIPACATDAKHRRSRVWIVANTGGGGFSKQNICSQQPWRAKTICASKTMPNITNARIKSVCKREVTASGKKWAVEPGVGRVANGVPRRVDRLKALGNAVVPQVVQELGTLIVQAEDQKIFPKKGE